MIGLALEGGGTKGSYQIGAYYAMKDCGIEFDGFCGTSIGSFNSAMLACGKEEELLEFWQNINVANALGFDSNYINKINKREIDLNFVKCLKCLVGIVHIQLGNHLKGRMHGQHRDS